MRVTLDTDDLAKIVEQANSFGRKGMYVFSLSIVMPKSATEANCSFAWSCDTLQSASESEPFPTIWIL